MTEHNVKSCERIRVKLEDLDAEAMDKPAEMIQSSVNPDDGNSNSTALINYPSKKEEVAVCHFPRLQYRYWLNAAQTTNPNAQPAPTPVPRPAPPQNHIFHGLYPLAAT